MGNSVSILKVQPMKKTGILYVNHVSRIAGAERGLLDLVCNLDRNEFDPFAAVPEGRLSSKLESAGIPTKHIEMRRFRKTINPIILFDYFINWRRAVKRLERVISEQSVALVHTNSNVAQIYAGPAASRCGVPCVWHCRDLVNLGPFYKWMAKHSRKVIAISGTVQTHLEKNGVDSHRIKVIYNAVDTQKFKPLGRREDVRRKMGIESSASVVAMIGQMVPWKNHSVFLDCAYRVLAEMPDAVFVVVGSDVFGENSAYEKQIKERARVRFGNKMVFTGYREDIDEVLEGVDVVVHPASREPFGRSIIEAMAMQIPVVAVDSCGPAEIIENGKSGILVPEGDLDAMVYAVLKLLKNKAAAFEMGQHALARVESGFSMKDFAANVKSVYMELLKQK